MALNCATSKAKSGTPTRGAVTVRAYIETPENGDLDNCIKTILDALQGIVYVNDKQVTELALYKNAEGLGSRIRVTWR